MSCATLSLFSNYKLWVVIYIFDWEIFSRPQLKLLEWNLWILIIKAQQISIFLNDPFILLIRCEKWHRILLSLSLIQISYLHMLGNKTLKFSVFCLRHNVVLYHYCFLCFKYHFIYTFLYTFFLFNYKCNFSFFFFLVEIMKFGFGIVHLREGFILDFLNYNCGGNNRRRKNDLLVLVRDWIIF